MSFPRTIAYVLALVALALPARDAAHAQENAVRIEFAGDSSRSTVIGAFRRSGTVYVSLNDLAQIFQLATYESSESQKFEVKKLPLRMKVAGGNPFIVVTDSEGRQNVYQLPARVVYAANSYFVPLASFLPLLRPVFRVNASYNPWTGVLGIGTQSVQPAFDIPTVSLEPKSNGMLIRIGATRKLREYENWMRADGWMYVTIGDARADIAAINAVKPAGIVREIIAIQSPTSVQLTFRLSGKIAASEIVNDDASNDLILAIRTPGAEETAPAPGRDKGEAPGVPTGPLTKADHETPQATPHLQDTARAAGSPPATSSGSERDAERWPTILPAPKKDTEAPGAETTPAAKPADRPPAATAPAPKKEHESPPGLDNEREKWALDVIVLDAGHGGYDPGTIGVTGVKEKTVALGIVLKLGALIQKNLKGVEVVYTRKDDRFVELDRRGKIANEAGGKLFISVHCNSLPRKPSKTRGFEVYLLRPGRSEEAIAIAERENSVIEMEPGYEEKYQQLTEENFILVAMAQSAHVKASEVFADLAQKEIASRTGIPNRGVKQAGFYVLVGAAMPNVLVESAYLSNREDERFLKSDSGQMKIADALFHAVKKYKEEYEKQLQEGKDFGEAKQ
ncbi:MAG TPA: N-acetylmuramoyl-L-alanine amidase [Bacteroidota bacterium]|nr:N-acetylmuramoyl-L-alanine amidase [Bacteroidota bacterium]